MLDLAHHVPPHAPIRLIPMSTRSASKKAILDVETMMLLHQTMMTILSYSASSMNVRTIKMISSLKKRNSSYQRAESALSDTITRKQKVPSESRIGSPFRSGLDRKRGGPSFT